MRIFETNDWNDFCFLKANREIVEGKKYRDLRASIEDKGYLISPIVVMNYDDQGEIVDLDDEEVIGRTPKYAVIDGQHRITICKELDMPVYVVINDRAKRSDVVTANNTGNKWGLSDYIKYFKENGNDQYIKLDQNINSYKLRGFKSSAVIEAMGLNGANTIHVKQGTYNIDETSGHQVLQACLAVKSLLPKVYQQVKMIRAFRNIFHRYPIFDVQVFAQNLREPEILNSFELKAVPSKDSNMILDIYARKFEASNDRHISGELKDFILAYYNHTCNYEGCSQTANHVDHIFPVSQGGITSVDNLQLLCADCNLHKSATIIEPVKQEEEIASEESLSPVKKKEGREQISSELSCDQPYFEKIVLTNHAINRVAERYNISSEEFVQLINTMDKEWHVTEKDIATGEIVYSIIIKSDTQDIFLKAKVEDHRLVIITFYSVNK